MPTVFEKIIARELPASIVYEDERCLAIHDIHPLAPVHVLLISKKPIQRLSQVDVSDQELLGHMMLQIPLIADKLGLKGGYRVVINNGPDSGEIVPHFHIHILGGKLMGHKLA